MIQKFLLVAAVATSLSSSVFAQSFCWSASADNTTLVAGTGIACSYGFPNFITAENRYWRRYNPAARGMTVDFMVTGFTFAVEQCQAGFAAPTQPATIQVFRDPTPNNPAPLSDLILLGSESIAIPNLISTLLPITLTTPIACSGMGTDDLVIALEIPDGLAQQNNFFFGGNLAGQSSPTYLSSVGCGIPDPLDLAFIGFPNSHMIFDVCGTAVLSGGVTYCTAKVNSQGCSPSIGSSGAMSATATSGFVLLATQELDSKAGLVLYSEFGRDASPFVGGLLCVKAPTQRSKGVLSGGSIPPACTGIFSIDFNKFGRGLLGTPPTPASYLSIPGQVVTAQFWGRDPGYAVPNNYSLSNGLEFTVGP